MKCVIKLVSFFLLTEVLINISCKKEYSCENCGDTNRTPVADTGPDQTIILPTDSVTLDGSASSDPDGMIKSFQWRKISGPASFNINDAAIVKTVVKNLTTGGYQFELKVTDNGGLSAKDTVWITVKDPAQPNRPPVANAGPDQVITLPINSINPDGSSSTDPDNNITNYAWTKIAGPSSFNISNPNKVQTQVTNLVQGIYQFELKITDGGGLFSKDTMEVTVNPGLSSQPSLANAGPDMIIYLPLDSAWINGYYTDSSIPGYEWTLISGPSVCTISNIHAPSTLVKNLVPGMYSFRLEFNSNGELSADTMIVLVVKDPQEQNTIIYKSLAWFISDIYGVGRQSLSIAKPDWYDLSNNTAIKVYLQMDSTSQWLVVPSTQAGFYYWMDCAGLFFYRLWIVPFPEDLSWVGRKSSIKIKIL